MTRAQRKRLLIKASPWLLLVALILFWELVCFAFSVPTYLFPAP
ncbi:MAG TPA: ABC transporter permease, partial [Pseudomonas sp.]|nr:ABC transporter permease [Pseudomonas sp.]